MLQLVRPLADRATEAVADFLEQESRVIERAYPPSSGPLPFIA
jgi:hypothetical protein